MRFTRFQGRAFWRTLILAAAGAAGWAVAHQGGPAGVESEGAGAPFEGTLLCRGLQELVAAGNMGQLGLLVWGLLRVGPDIA